MTVGTISQTLSIAEKDATPFRTGPSQVNETGETKVWRAQGRAPCLF